MLNQCFNQPKQNDELPNNSYWLTFCQPTGLECYIPSAPDLDADTTADNVQANTVLFKGTKPADFDADVAYWLITRTKSGVRVPHFLYVQRSGIPSGLPAGTVRFGAPGLVQPVGDSGWDFSAQVSYCSEVAPGTLGKCTCYSLDSATQTTAGFDGVDPDDTTGPLEIQVEDQFRRPNTTTTITNGVGLGPMEVWLEVAAGSLGRPTIIDTERVAAPQGTNMVFVAREATKPHVYTEVLYRRATAPATGTLPYNVDATGRVHIAAGTTIPKALEVKLVNETSFLEHSSDPTQPELQIRSISGNSVSDTLHAWQIFDLDENGTACDGNLPLADDPAQIIYLKFESDDGDSDGDPRVRAAVGWGGCTEDGGLASCSFECQTDWWPYDDDPLNFQDVDGWSGFFVHHRAYRVEAFRAGSAPPQ
jgi:hypothetical protein